jgi:hypothetical protein
VRTALVLVLAVILLTAGCSTVDVPGGSGTPTAEATPVPVGTAEPTPGASGLTLRGVQEPSELADAHATALSNTTFRLVSEERLVSEAGTTLVHSSKRVTVGRTPGRYHYTAVSNGTFSWQFPTVEREELYANGSHVYGLTARDDGQAAELLTTAGTEPVAPSQVMHDDPTRRWTIYTHLSRLGGVTVEPVGGGDYRIHGTRFEGNTVAGPAGVVRNVTLHEFAAVVGPDSVVRGYWFSYEGTFRGRRVTGRVAVRYEEIGTATVERPDWVETATVPTATPTATGTATPTPEDGE